MMVRTTFWILALSALGACKHTDRGSELASTDALEKASPPIPLETFLASEPGGGWRERLATASQSVVLIKGAGWSCTGWVLTERHVIANQHCFVNDMQKVSDTPLDFDRGICARMSVVFGHQAAHPRWRQQGQAAPKQATIRCKRILVANHARDFAILELASAAPVAPLRLAAEPSKGGAVVSVGHPGGAKKTIYAYTNFREAKGMCRVKDLSFKPGKTGEEDHPHHRLKNRHAFLHTCGGRFGASGSPILSRRSLRVVGIHWLSTILCGFAHYMPKEEGGIYDASTQQYIEPSSRAISIASIRKYVLSLPEGDAVGQVPAAVRQAFLASES